ncbi:hypothetical protein GDO86_012137 [Hymenochirus boettgeri]|uniref:IgGFc-binding protein N-terminal domain-containing protein n=1 Tax=Hymenochirus boettgeri TaxID=247094 RepID=A0A8T2INX0_9PIPI|nr:hypothetical protein GDO86_012137 [Hymenochirus boettgeri]
MGKVTFLQLWALLGFLGGTCLAAPMGKEFVTVFMQNYQTSYSVANFQVFITGYQASTTVTITMNKSNFQKVVTVGERSSSIVSIPANAEIPGTSKTCNVIIIKADKDITVQTMNFKVQSADTSIVFPTQQLGTEYYVVTPLEGPPDGFKQFSVVSSSEPTNIDIYLKEQ